MRFGSLTEELNSITKDYDYGIVPGSAAVFVKDEIMGIGRLDLTLLEGVIVVIELSDQGYKIASSSPLSNDPATLAAAEQVQACVDQQVFETMESLLMTASPLFRERFQSTLYDKLHKVQQLQQLQLLEEEQQQQQSGLQQSMVEDDTLIPSDIIETTATTATGSSSTTATESYGQQPPPSLSPTHPYDHHHLHHHTNESAANLSSSFNHNTNSTLDQQDLLDEINQWIH